MDIFAALGATGARHYQGTGAVSFATLPAMTRRVTTRPISRPLDASKRTRTWKKSCRAGHGFRPLLDIYQWSATFGRHFDETTASSSATLIGERRRTTRRHRQYAGLLLCRECRHITPFTRHRRNGRCADGCRCRERGATPIRRMI